MFQNKTNKTTSRNNKGTSWNKTQTKQKQKAKTKNRNQKETLSQFETKTSNKTPKQKTPFCHVKKKQIFRGKPFYLQSELFCFGVSAICAETTSLIFFPGFGCLAQNILAKTDSVHENAVFLPSWHKSCQAILAKMHVFIFRLCWWPP